jgi:hypothetical protein
MAKVLKSLVPDKNSEAVVPPSQPRPTADQIRQVAERMAPNQPPAIMPRRSKTLINIRIETALADWLAATAEGEGTTQKVIITRALAAAGAPVSPQDLEDRTPRRRR